MPGPTNNSPTPAEPTQPGGASLFTSRRVFTAATVGGLATIAMGDFPAAAELPLVQTVSSQWVATHYGVCVHPTFNESTSPYKIANQDQWFQRLADTGARFMRGLYKPEHPATPLAVQKCRDLGIKWLMTIVPEGDTGPTDQTELRTREIVQHIAANAGDVCYGIEGINEPNDNRSGAPVPPDWATTTLIHQRAIWQESRATQALATKDIIGPSLHDLEAYRSYQQGYTGTSGPQHWQQLANAGIAAYQTWAGVHRYPGGEIPTDNLAERLGYVRDAYGPSVPIWATETGYHNALGNPPSNPVDKVTSGIYGPRTIMEFTAKRGIPVTRYELLDDPDSTNANQQSNFGLVNTPSADPLTWSAKVEVAKVRALIDLLSDPGSPYTTAPVRLAVDPSKDDIQWVVARKRDGSARIYLWRSASVWDTTNETRIASGTVSYDTVVTDKNGPRTISVGANVVSLALRLN